MAPRFDDFHRRSIQERDAFWAEQAGRIDWHVPPQRICDYDNPPFARWFVGGQTNLCHNAVDRHLAERADQNALIAISTETGTEKVYTYRELHAEVQRMAADAKPPNTTEWMAPSRAQASMAGAASAIMGM
jgi:propionyl-CoA synthetase